MKTELNIWSQCAGNVLASSHVNKNYLHKQDITSQPTELKAVESNKYDETAESALSGVEIEDLIKTIKDEKKLTICHKKLNVKTAELLSQTLERSYVDQMVEIKLRNCEITDEFLNTLLICIKKRYKFTSETLNLSANKGLDLRTVKKVCELLQAKHLDLSDIDMSEAQVLGLSKFTDIKKLELRANTFDGDSIGESLATLINGGLKMLVLDDSEISGEDLQHIAENMSPKNQLTGLDLSHVTLDKTGAEALCQILSKVKELEWLHLHDCGLDEEQIKMFLSVIGKNSTFTIKNLKLSSNPGVKNSITTVAKIVDKLKCEDIDISRNSLHGEDFDKLATASTPSKVKIIHISENPIGDWAGFGRLIKKWSIINVDASQCRMYPQDAKDFAVLLGTHKLKELNVTHTDRDKKFTSTIFSALKDVACTVIINSETLFDPR